MKSKKNIKVNTKQNVYVFSSIETDFDLFFCSAWSRLYLITAKIMIEVPNRVIKILSYFDNSGSFNSSVVEKNKIYIPRSNI